MRWFAVDTAERERYGRSEPPEGQLMKMRVLAAVAVAIPLAFGTSRLMAQGNSDIHVRPAWSTLVNEVRKRTRIM